MLRIPAADGKTYNAVGWTTFKKWLARIAVAFTLLGIGSSTGLYYFGVQENKNLIREINSLSMKNCLSSIKRDSILNKYNDLINSIVEIRSESRDHALAQGDAKAAQIDQKAIKRYESDRAPIPTEEQCTKPIIK